MPLIQIIMNMLNTILVIVAFASIFNFITMICQEITISTTICILLFIVMFIVNMSASYALLDAKPLITNYGIDEQGNKFIISQETNPEYQGNTKYYIAKVFYLLNPESQANEIQGNSTEYMYEMPFYTTMLIIVVNIGGIIIFSKKQLK